MERMYGPSFNKFVVVKDRLDFIHKLIKFRSLFRLDIRDDMDNFIEKWKNPYREYSALRFYLALTCFDTLGQRDKYVSFEEWIKGKKYKKEVDLHVRKIQQTEEDPLVISQLLIKRYNQKYSMQNSFKRFVYELLNEEYRYQLFQSIKIRKIFILGNGKGRQDISFMPTEKQKFNFLISVRNYYTHKSIPTGTLYLGDDSFDEDVPNTMFDPTNKKIGYYPVRQERCNNYYYEYSVRKWPSLLIELVKKTLDKMEREELKT